MHVLIIKPTRCTNFSIVFGIKLHMFRTFPVHHQEFLAEHTAVPSWSCSQAVRKPVIHMPLLCVQWKTPDDGQRNCSKHVEFYYKNKLEKLVHLVGFVIRICHDARPPERTIAGVPYKLTDWDLNPHIRHKTLVLQCYKKVKWSRYMPVVAQRVGRGITLLFHYRGTRRGWAVSSTPRPHFTPGKDLVPILQGAGWAPGPVWTSGKSRPHRDSIPNRPARNLSLYRLSYPAHVTVL